MAFVLVNTSASKGINTETAKGNSIDNYQVSEISHYEKNLFGGYTKEKYPTMIIRSEASPMYDCHGLTFASRRTNIDKSTEIEKILNDDEYSLINERDVLPGDVVLYVDQDDGDISHSGIVVNAEFPPESLSIILVISKWGKFKEIIHNVNDCPYPKTYKRYYRIKNEDYA